MKIVIIGQKGIPGNGGGVEKHVEDLAVALHEAGNEVLVYTRPNYTPKTLKEWKGVTLVSLPTIPTKHLSAIVHTFIAVLDASFRRRPDVIHFHSIGPSSMVGLARLLNPRTPIVFTFHSQCYYNQKWGRIAKACLKFGENLACRFADAVITVSKGLEAYVKENYPKHTPNYLPNGILPAKAKAAALIKESWGLEKGSYILAVSRLVRNKGLEYLIESFKSLGTDKKLVIAGSGNFKDELKALAGNDQRIIFTGNQTGQALEELLSNAYAFIQPSESEGLSIALLEAMSYGLPCLVSDIPANLEAIGQTGLSFKSQDVSSLTGKLTEMLKLTEDKLAALGQSAKERTISEYDWNDIAKRTAELYRSLIAKKGK